MRRTFDNGLDLEVPSAGPDAPRPEGLSLLPLGLALLAAAGAAAAALFGGGAEAGAGNVMMLTICAFPRLTE